MGLRISIFVKKKPLLYGAPSYKSEVQKVNSRGDYNIIINVILCFLILWYYYVIIYVIIAHRPSPRRRIKTMMQRPHGSRLC